MRNIIALAILGFLSGDKKEEKTPPKKALKAPQVAEGNSTLKDVTKEELCATFARLKSKSKAEPEKTEAESLYDLAPTPKGRPWPERILAPHDSVMHVTAHCDFVCISLSQFKNPPTDVCQGRWFWCQFGPVDIATASDMNGGCAIYRDVGDGTYSFVREIAEDWKAPSNPEPVSLFYLATDAEYPKRIQCPKYFRDKAYADYVCISRVPFRDSSLCIIQGQWRWSQNMSDELLVITHRCGLYQRDSDGNYSFLRSVG